MPGRYTQEDYERMAGMREQGHTYVQIAARFGCSASVVSWQCLRLGAEPPKARYASWTEIKGPAVSARGDHLVRRFTEPEDALLLELEASGLSVNAIARRLGRRTSSIRGRLMTLARRDARSEAA
jgi:transposase-like protein